MEEPLLISQNHPPALSKKRKFETPLPSPDRVKRVVLEQVSHVDIIGTGPSGDDRFALARAVAQSIHKAQMLSPSGTLVVRRGNPPSSPDTFVFTHPKSHINTILVQEQALDGQHAALRVFFDCLYAQCGYKTWYQRDDFCNFLQLKYRLRCVVKKGKKQKKTKTDSQEPSPRTSESHSIGEGDKSTDSAMTHEPAEVSDRDQPAKNDDTSTDRPEYTEEEKKIYVRYHAVMNKVLAGEMGLVTAMEVKYLAGQESGYHSLHSSHHAMSVKAVAVHLERLTPSFQRRRRRALAKAFKWLTGYDSYASAYENAKENRRLTDKGLVGQALEFDDEPSDGEVGNGTTRHGDVNTPQK